jgi:hypothetical protein
MSASGPIVLVTAVGRATGSRAAAAALACAGSEVDRAALLVDLDAGFRPRPSLISTAAARALEERLVAHPPTAEAVSRGSFCRLTLPAEADGIERLSAALPAVRESVAVVHLSPRLLQPVLAEPRVAATGVLLRADLGIDRALAALVVRELHDRGLRVGVLKRPLGWVGARLALLGIPPRGGIPDRTRERLSPVAGRSA